MIQTITFKEITQLNKRLSVLEEADVVSVSHFGGSFFLVFKSRDRLSDQTKREAGKKK